jgi:serine/threonine protein kinase
VNFLESIEKDDNIYIVMELCDGDLNDLLENKNENLDIITIIKIINQLNEVLKLMRSKKIEHRDLKPENILIKYNYDYLFNYIIVGDMGKIFYK